MMNRSGSGPQPLRGMPGNVFQNQQAPGSRTGSMGSGRLQNGKIAGTSSGGWGYNPAGAPGLPNTQSRSNPANPSSFAQSIGGRNNAPLDLSEFPSLSGAPQSQQQNTSSQSIWNPSARGPQNAPIQRPSQQGQSAGPSGSSAQHQPPPQHPAQAQPPSQQYQSQRSEPQPDQSSSIFSPSNTNVDGLRFDPNPPANRGSGASPDDFPPLGGLGDTDLNGRQIRPGQGSHFGGLGPPGPYLSSQNRGGPLGQTDVQTDGLSHSNHGNQLMSPSEALAPSRSPLDNPREGSSSGPRPSADPDGFSMNLPSQRPLAPDSGAEPPQHRESNQPGGEHAQGAPARAATGELAQMSELDRFGINGFMSMLRRETADQPNFLVGIDLSSLGLELQRPDNAPLHVDWAGPFADPNTRSLIPEFTLPPSYSVHNVPDLSSKISSFSNETLFAIFYQNPRDQAQELAANELYNRDWRWHKKLQQWMMKAKELGEPMTLASMKEERGFYYFFDVNNWRQERKEFILNYEHLYHGQVHA